MFRLEKGEGLENPDEGQTEGDDATECIGSECERLPWMIMWRVYDYVNYELNANNAEMMPTFLEYGSSQSENPWRTFLLFLRIFDKSLCTGGER